MSDHLKIFHQTIINHKKISRIKQLFNIQVRYHRSNPNKRDQGLPDVQTLGITNLVKGIVPSYPNHIWSSDFTYLLFKSEWYYVATLKDNYTREIVGWHFGKYHTTNLITEALNKAVSVFGYPQYLHSDQGSEYRATSYLDKCKDMAIQISMSAKGHPWENGYQESYYNYFKLELGNVNIYDSLDKLEFAIGRQIWHYNNYRIHSSIRTAPTLFRSQIKSKMEQTDVKTNEKLELNFN
jgi:transposase InsO family protein